jgi:phosphoribosylaminoimidazolecarboxamide formyltransferase/IMP cyclohydrolase
MEGIGFDEVVEMIDIGGPTLVRAAAKNFRHTGVLVDPADYSDVLAQLRASGSIAPGRRFELARKAFRHVAAYDTAIFSYLAQLDPEGALMARGRASMFPPRLSLEMVKAQDLRYGENPHQAAAAYRTLEGNSPSVMNAEQMQGKELSFNNLLDLDAALRLASDFREPVCGAVKHGNPCGVGTGRDAREAFERARESDPVSIFGGILGFNVEVDEAAAAAIAELFLEAVIAPAWSAEALRLLAGRKNLRLLRTGGMLAGAPAGLDLRRVSGGFLVQEWDRPVADLERARVVTRRAPDRAEREAMAFAWTVVRHVRSNAIVYATRHRTLGIGAGQMSRVDAVRFGAQKAGSSLAGCALASDAFFPFRDNVDEAAAAGVKAIVQPGGSVRDDEVIAAADEHGLAMLFTGARHFRH